MVTTVFTTTTTSTNTNTNTTGEATTETVIMEAAVVVAAAETGAIVEEAAGTLKTHQIEMEAPFCRFLYSMSSFRSDNS